MNHIGRKLYHVIGGTGLLSIYYLFDRERALLLYAILFAAALAFDAMRLAVPGVNRFVFRHFGDFIRKKEQDRLTGTAYYIIGVGMSFAVFSRPAATAAICFLIFGDAAAATIGERYGKSKIGGKSLEGTAAFIVAALAAGGFLSSIGLGTAAWVMLAGALVAAGTELLSLPVNDNLVIPVISGAVMQFLINFAR